MKLKKVLIGVGGLLVLAGSAGAGYYFMAKPAEADVETPKVEVYKDPVRDPKFVDIDALVIPVIANGRIKHHVFLELSLEVDGKNNGQKVLEQKRRLHHAFLMALYDGPIQAPDAGGLNTDAIKSIVKRESLKVLGKDLVEAVRIQQAIPGQN